MRCASAGCGPSSRCWRPRPPTAPSTAPGWTSSTSRLVMERLLSSAERRFGINRYAIARADGLHVARDLHAGPRRQRGGRGDGAAPLLRRGGRRNRGLQHQGPHRPHDGRGRGGRRRGQGAGARHRAAGAQLQGARPRAGRAEPQPRRPLPGAVRAAPGGRLRLADQHDPVPAHPGRTRPGRRQAPVRALAGRRQRV